MSKKGGHHGGAWKVAYADFVTAMMALFLVLWLVSQDTKIKEAVERAFRNPFMSVTKESTGIIPSDQNQVVETKAGNYNSASMMELAFLRRLNQELMDNFKKEPDEENGVKLELLSDGLRISVFDRSRKPIFEPDSDDFTDYGNWVFSTLAWVISGHSNCVVELEGHTEQGHKNKSPKYGMWELSTDRALAARRKVLDHGVKEPQICRIIGLADTTPMKDTPPQDESNRRVTVMIRPRSNHPPS